MRFVMAALILTLVLPIADAAGSKGGCSGHCDSVYATCMNRAKSGQARKACKTTHKACQGTCSR
jgi:hypothetical protein